MKTFKLVSAIDIIEGLCQLGNVEQCGKFEMPWSKDNSEQEAKLIHMFLPNDGGKSKMETTVNDDMVIEVGGSNCDQTLPLVYPAGWYVYSYNESLPQLHKDYCIKLELCIDIGVGCTPQFEEVYLYCIGD